MEVAFSIHTGGINHGSSKEIFPNVYDLPPNAKPWVSKQLMHKSFLSQETRICNRVGGLRSQEFKTLQKTFPGPIKIDKDDYICATNRYPNNDSTFLSLELFDQHPVLGGARKALQTFIPKIEKMNRSGALLLSGFYGKGCPKASTCDIKDFLYLEGVKNQSFNLGSTRSSISVSERGVEFVFFLDGEFLYLTITGGKFDYFKYE